MPIPVLADLKPDLTAFAEAYRFAFIAWVEACQERAGADRATVKVTLNPINPSHARCSCGSPPRVIGTFGPCYVKDAVQFEAWVDLGLPRP